MTGINSTKIIINKQFFNKSDERTKTILKHIGLSSMYKSVSILITFFLVPLSISYLGSEKYGLWLTIFSFIGWFSFFDFGIGNGLRNKLTIALSQNNIELAKAYISTAYFSILFVVIVLIFLFIIPFYLIPWDSVFNYTGDESLSQLIAIVYIIFSINLVLKMISTVYYADQKASTPGLMNMIGQIIIFFSIYIAMQSTNSSLILYGSIVIGAQMLIFILASIIAFSGKYASIKPNIKAFKKEHIKDILSLGGKFFLIQIAAIMIYSTDNFVINYFLGGEQVTIYNIAFKYFMIVTMMMSIILEPYWSAFTNATTHNDDEWIKQSIKNLLKISVLASLVIVVMIFIADKAYLLWVGNSIEIPFLLTMFMGINTIIQVFLQPIIMYINGVGKLKIQLFVGLTAAVINIPLSILLAVHLELGITGIILATIMTRMIGLTIYPRQTYKLINKTAKGIWNE
jgi:O-antigen/teichoic acid export membrane protein